MLRVLALLALIPSAATAGGFTSATAAQFKEAVGKHEGKIVLVYFWSVEQKTAAGTLKRAEELLRLADPKKVVVMTMSIDEASRNGIAGRAVLTYCPSVANYRSRHGKAAARIYKLSSLPTVIMFDPNGDVVWRANSASSSKVLPAVRAADRKYFSEK